jgi:gliding motility associated protien GldN
MHKPTPYPFVREADVMFSKRVWRTIMVDEKMNLLFKYATGTSKIGEHVSLIDAFLCGISKGLITAYDASVDDGFSKAMSKEEVQRKLNGYLDSIKIPTLDSNRIRDTVILKGKLNTNDIIMYRIKEDWYFDKHTGEMNVRILGICPVVMVRDEYGHLAEGYQPLFWIYFPAARNILANVDAFNNHNDNELKSWDDIFMKRMFNSYIYKSSNVMDKSISDNVPGMNQLLESQKVKQELQNFEHDMWEY